MTTTQPPTPRRHNQPYSPAEEEAIRQMRAERIPYAEIAARLGRPYTSVAQRISALGLTGWGSRDCPRCPRCEILLSAAPAGHGDGRCDAAAGQYHTRTRWCAMRPGTSSPSGSMTTTANRSHWPTPGPRTRTLAARP